MSVRTFAIVPAAGKSTRMGTAKLALPLGSSTVLEQLIGVLAAAQMDDVVVVLAPHVTHMQEAARKAGARVLLLSEHTPDMRTTVERGLDYLERNMQPAPDDSWLLVPADHPTLDANVIRILVEEREHRPQNSIFVPTFRGKRGHPTLIGWGHVAGIRTLPANTGLNAYFRAVPEAVCEVPVESAEVLCDLDTPEDYQRLLQRWANAIR